MSREISRLALIIKFCPITFILLPTILANIVEDRNVISATGACGVFANIDKNDLTPIDVVVKNPESKIACIRARFSLAIKVEAPIEIKRDEYDDYQHEIGITARPDREISDPRSDHGNYIQLNEVLGYLPLEQVVSVEQSCPEWIRQPAKSAGQQDSKRDPKTSGGMEKANNDSLDERATKKTSNADVATEDTDTDREQAESKDYLEMIVTFECGKLAFTFMRNETCTYLGSIRGMIRLDEKVVREFYVAQPMLITSDLNHHFKFDELIQISSQAKSRAYILSANLYLTEIETFRNTTNTDFIKPPDENSKPFPELDANPVSVHQ